MTPSTFRTSTPIRFSDADPAGILFFGRVFELAHAALETFVRDSGIGWNHWFACQECAVPIVNAEADYATPMHAGSTVDIDLTVSKLGSASVCFAFRFSTNGVLNATVRTTHVFVSTDGWQSRPIPHAIRQVLASYLIVQPAS